MITRTYLEIDRQPPVAITIAVSVVMLAAIILGFSSPAQACLAPHHGMLAPWLAAPAAVPEGVAEESAAADTVHTAVYYPPETPRVAVVGGPQTDGSDNPGVAGSGLLVPALHTLVAVTAPLAATVDTMANASAEEFVSVPITAGHSGAWSSPQRDGEGVQVEILGADRALVFWFTYPPAAEQTAASSQAESQQHQFWMGGPGRIEGHQIIIDDVVSTSGPVFGPDFDPADVVRTPWGRLVIEFASCGQGRIVYAGPPAFGSGTIALQRLTGNPRTPCGADPADYAPPSAAAPGVSGNWFDPAHDGEGWFIQELAPGVAGFSWLTYNANGGQVWLLGVGFWNGRTLLVPAMQITRGAAFGDDFDPAAVVREAWGPVQFVFDSCDRATLIYNSPLAGFGAGVLRPVRLTRSDFLPCAFEPLRDLSAGGWQVQNGAPRLSELPAAVIGDAIYVAGGFRGGFRSRAELWRHRPASGEWVPLRDLPQARDHGMMTALEGYLYFFGGFVEGIPTATAWRYDPAADRWETLASMPHSRAAGAAVHLDGMIYVVGGEARFIDRYDPLNNRWDSFALPEVVGRDHSNAVAFRDEIWLMGGRTGGNAHGTVTIFNPLTGVIRNGPAFQRGRSGYAAAVFNNQIIVAGGEDFAPLETIGSVEFYSPEVGAWQFTTALPTPVHGVSGVSFDGHFYLMLGSVRTGGVDNPGLVQIFTPPQ